VLDVTVWQQRDTLTVQAGAKVSQYGVDIFTDDLRYDVEMEILQQIMDMAWYEATGKWPKPRRNFDDPEPDWD